VCFVLWVVAFWLFLLRVLQFAGLFVLVCDDVGCVLRVFLVFWRVVVVLVVVFVVWNVGGRVRCVCQICVCERCV